MRFKNYTRQRKKPIQGLRSFNDSLPKDIKKIIINKADIYSKIIDNWKKIVGTDLFEACTPISFKSLNNSKIKLINISVKKGKEIDVEYSRKVIIDKINTFLGYKFVNSIKLSASRHKGK